MIQKDNVLKHASKTNTKTQNNQLSRSRYLTVNQQHR
jgi:hypothetical protein